MSSAVSGPRRIRPARAQARQFVLYVEGPSDRDILRVWARCLSPRLARELEPCAVILGGRQPSRAIRHFRELREENQRLRGVCVLDRDDGVDAAPTLDEPGLRIFTWPRRHIESYLLVPGAIARCAGLSSDDPRIDRVLRAHLPDSADEDALRQVDAKRLLAPTGDLSRALGVPLSVGRVVRSLRGPELHTDIVGLFEHLREGVTQRDPLFEAVGRRAGPPPAHD